MEDQAPYTTNRPAPAGIDPKELQKEMNADIMKSLIDGVSDYMKQRYAIIDDLCLSALSLMKPPVKGELTKGKLKWRGVKIVYDHTVENEESVWIEQRGKKISLTVTICS